MVYGLIANTQPNNDSKCASAIEKKRNTTKSENCVAAPVFYSVAIVCYECIDFMRI